MKEIFPNLKFSDNWQVLLETDYDSGTSTESDLRLFVYGNYIDEVLFMEDTDNSDGTPAGDYYYLHDHLYSPAALLSSAGTVVERYEYDAYGQMTRLNANFTAFSGTEAGNPYYFTGRRLDSLDSGDLEPMHYRHRAYDTHTGRFMQQDPFGTQPAANAKINPFKPTIQYTDGLNLMTYSLVDPVNNIDFWGLWLPPMRPPQPPTPQKKCGKCGPDVTGSLILLMTRIERDFNNLNEEEKKENCYWPFEIVPPFRASDAWNIRSLKGELWPHRRDRNPNSDCPSEGECDGTVTYNGQCYDAHAVNYAIFGKIGSLCDQSWTLMYIMMQWHKRITYDDPEILPETLQWAKWGYLGDHEAHLPTSTHKHCKPCKECLHMRMEYKWEPNIKIEY